MQKLNRNSSTSTLGKIAELAIVAPQVVAMRTAQMLAAGATPNARDREEFSRMGPEKVAAFGESMLGMGRQLVKTNQEYTRSIFIRLMRMWMTPWWLAAYRPVTQTIASLPTPMSLLTPSRRQQQRAVSQLIATAVAPVHKRATSNAKRLIARAVAPAHKRATPKSKRLIAKAAAPARKRATTSAKRRASPKKRARG